MTTSKRGTGRSARVGARDPERDHPERIERICERYPVVAVRDVGPVVERDDEDGRELLPGERLYEVLQDAGIVERERFALGGPQDVVRPALGEWRVFESLDEAARFLGAQPDRQEGPAASKSRAATSFFQRIEGAGSGIPTSLPPAQARGHRRRMPTDRLQGRHRSAASVSA